MVEQRPFKPKVVGSIPTAPTKFHETAVEVKADLISRKSKLPPFRDVAKGWATRQCMSVKGFFERDGSGCRRENEGL